jgi:uncharacterized membrane protein HdeD (DUF308 family)
MGKNAIALILIILGLIVIAVPLLGLVPLAVLTGLAVVFLGIGLILAGLSDWGESKALGIVEVILGIIALVLGLGFILSPSLFSFVAALIVYLAGIILIIVGLIGIATKAGNSRWNGVVAIVIGLIYLLLGYIIKDPFYFGMLIGIWLLLTGLILFLQKE